MTVSARGIYSLKFGKYLGFPEISLFVFRVKFVAMHDGIVCFRDE